MADYVLTWAQLGQIVGGLGAAYAVVRGWALVRRLVWGSL